MKFKVTSFKRTGLNSDSLVLKNCELEIVTNDNQKILKITSSFTKYVSIFKMDGREYSLKKGIDFID